jgi:hypothetical protein
VVFSDLDHRKKKTTPPEYKFPLFFMEHLIQQWLTTVVPAGERLVLLCQMGRIDPETQMFHAQVHSKTWNAWCDDLEKSTDVLRVQPAEKYILCHHVVESKSRAIRGRYAINTSPCFTAVELVGHVELTSPVRPEVALSFQLWREINEERFTPDLYRAPQTVQLCIAVTSSYRNQWNYVLSKCKGGATKCLASRAPEQLMFRIEWTASYLAQCKDQHQSLPHIVHQIVEHGKDLLVRELDHNHVPEELPHQWHKVSRVCETYL